ncbi:MAG: PilZ domain-containing protein [Elusimicrobia bacterium]|nr:PilZ domain-containing protein [Elusimicrobiota bacterium]
MNESGRTHQRWPSDLVVEVFSGPVGGVRIGEGVLLDLSLTGCLLRVRGLLKVGSTYRISVIWQDATLDLPGRVARDAGRSGTDAEARHYGIAFNLTGGQERSLRGLLDHVRRNQKPEDGGFLRNYWG